MDDRLRILFISMEYPPETGGGGIGSYLVSTAPALAAQGHEVHVLSCAPGQEHRDYSALGVSMHRRGLAYIRGLGRLRAPYTAVRIRSGLSTLQAVRGLKLAFDAIEYPDWGAEGWAVSLARRAPLLAHLHTPLPLIQEYNALERNCDVAVASWLERLSVRRAHRILSASQLLVTALTDLGWLKGRTVDIIPYAIDWPRWSHVPAVTAAGPTVLYLGRLEPRKAPEFLVAAIRILRAEMSEARVMFVGRCSGCYGGTPYEQWVRQLSADANSGCVYLEQVPRDALPRLFAGTRVLAMPSRFDSFGMVALEAMAAGRPVVLTDTTGAAEIVRGTGGGRVVPAGDAVALADALRPFLRRPDYAYEVGQAARSTVQTLLDPDRMAARRAALYQRARRDAARRG